MDEKMDVICDKLMKATVALAFSIFSLEELCKNTEMTKGISTKDADQIYWQIENLKKLANKLLSAAEN